MYPVNIMQDASKWIMVVPKTLTGCFGIWPEQEKNTFTKLAFWMLLLLCVVISTGQFLFLTNNWSDIMNIVSTMISLSPNIQVIIIKNYYYMFNKVTYYFRDKHRELCFRSL